MTSIKECNIMSDGRKIHSKLERPSSIRSDDEKGPLAILVHGFTGHMEEEHILGVRDEFLDNGFSVLRVEMYGHGTSDGEFKDHTLIKWIDQMMTVVDYASKLPFVTELYLAGHSQGGLLTIIVGALEHDRLAGIMPLSPAISIPVDANKGNTLGGEFDPEHIPSEIRRAVTPGFEVDPETLTLGGNYFRIAQLIPVEECIKRFKDPVLIVHGDADEVIPVQFAYDAADQYADCKLEIIKGADHCYHGHMEEVRAAIGRFLRR